LTGVAGKDATKKFDKYHRRGILERYKPSLAIGALAVDEVTTGSRRGLLNKLSMGR
jgi:hypothetical protein